VSAGMGEPAVERWYFGEQPLDQTRELAIVLRELMGTAVGLEAESPELATAIEDLRALSERLAAAGPADPRPRVGASPRDEQRVYLDHSRDIGEYNAAFPRYEITVADDRAEGTVEFPVVYEGPPGVVHGGFLAVFFDCILQHLSCDMGRAGKTKTLSLRYRRPTPIRTPLEFSAERVVTDETIEFTAELRDGDTVVCLAEMSAVLGKRENLPAVSPRRV
jgi:hypothetical protein